MILQKILITFCVYVGSSVALVAASGCSSLLVLKLTNRRISAVFLRESIV